MKVKVKYIFLVLIITTSSKLLSQNTDLLFSNGYIKIFKSRALVMNDTIYDSNADFERLRKAEETDECKVEYSFYYNPLSLVGKYYSYELGKGGVIACGVPSNSLTIRTIDLISKKETSLSDIFEESSILKALKSDKWVQKIGKENNIDFSRYNNLGDLIIAINKLGYSKFKLSSFAILKYSEEKNKVAVRFIGETYIGFNHNQHLQLGLMLIPKANFKNQLINKTEFVLGKFKNGLTN